MGDIRARLALVSLWLPLLAVVGLAAGCGDNTPAKSGLTGGTGGSAGRGGNAGSGTAGAAGSDAGAGQTGTDAGGSTGRADASTDVNPDAPPPACYTTAFTSPAAGATLTVADDTDHSCANGFQVTVTISSSAPNGTDVSLFDGSSLLKTVQVTGGAASFAVQLPSSGTTQLSVQYPSTSTCNVQENVTVTCPNSPPTCAISAPTISATHPDLNGVPAPSGDRTSSAGSAYQATFVVNTSAEDGQPVSLAVDNAAAPGTITTLNATASAGSATFGVTLVPDATYEVTATCTNKNGITGTSTKSSYPVDTTPPVLTVNSPTSGQFFGPSSLTNGAFQVCAQTSSADAAGLSAALGAAQKNLCVALGASSNCVAVSAINTSTCVAVTCPGGAPFSLAFTLDDAAGNPTTQTVTGVSCASTLPSVQIIAPVSDAPAFTDPTKHILAGNAHPTVVACTDTAGSATLSVGHQGTALTQLGASTATTAAVAGDNCPSGLGFVVRFPTVTLPESNENGNGTLSAATEIKVTLTSSANGAAVGTSAPVDLWVDTVPPVLTLTAPAGLCGSFTQSAATVTEDVSYTADDDLVTAVVTNNGSTNTYDTPAFIGGVASFPNVAFAEGQNTLIASESDPAGNTTTLAACTVTIGSAPVVTFTTPTAGAILCPSTATDTDCIDDTDPGTAGWQGNLAVTVLTANGAVPDGTSVTFTVGATTLGVATTVGGAAQINGITLPEGVDTITATTGNVPNAGVGSGSVNVTVDTVPPNAPTNLNLAVVNRRKTSIQATWTAPSDSNGNSVVGYQVRCAKVPITTANFDDPSVIVVPYTGAPASPGQLDGVTVGGLYIESGYYCGVEATDIAGSRSALLATPSGGTCTCAGQCCAAHFNVTNIPSPPSTSARFGFSVSGDGDLNGDGLSDILVGTSSGGSAYMFLGSQNFGVTPPAVTFTGASSGFGFAVAQIGDIDNDLLPDVAIADTTSEKVFIYKGRKTWPMTLTDAQADYVISTDATYAGSFFGFSLTPLGDFTGDGIDDFAIGATSYAGGVGRVVIIPGKAAGFASISLPDTTNSIFIDGDATLGSSFFGYRVLGLGHFYSVSSGTTLVASAPFGGSSVPPNVGHVYAFHGQTGTAGVIPIAGADSVKAGLANGSQIGVVLTNLGTMLNGFPGVGIGNTLDTVDVPGANGTGYLTFGVPASGPFATSLLIYLAGVNSAGGSIIGGGVWGRDIKLSLIGDATPDLVFGGQVGSILTISDGAKIGAKPSPNNLAATAEVQITLPSGWGSGEGAPSIITDINGDNAPDFCLGSLTNPGAILVYW
jgi:hypothetical protein